jgi:hypothetical protein
MRVHAAIGTVLSLCLSTFCAAAPPSGDVAAWVDRKVAECAPKPEERRFDRTGWLTDIRSALEFAKRHNRPVFLFTHDGRMGVGRC